MTRMERQPVDIEQDEPLKLAEACERLFHGRIKPATLRAEYRRGRLVLERIGRADFVTVRAIEEMRRLCRIQQSALASGSDRRDQIGKPRGSSSTAANISPRDALNAKLRRPISASPSTSGKSIPHRAPKHARRMQ